MARAKKKRAAKPAGDSVTHAESPESTPTGDTGGTVRRRDIRPFVYAAFDLILLVIWIVVLTKVLPNRHGWANVILWSMVLSFLVMGAAMFVRSRWGWRIGVAACAFLLVVWLVTVVIMLMSAAFLSGVYGGFGQAAAMGTLVAVLMTLQLVALIPALQLKFLMTRAGRRYFGQRPFWS